MLLSPSDMNDMDAVFEKVYDQARAKVFWGEDSDAVMEFLLERGVDQIQAKMVCDEAFEEYRADVRADGRRKALAGAGLLTLGALVFCTAFFEWVPDYAIPGSGATGWHRGRLPSLYQVLFSLGIAGFLFGGYWLVNGMFEAVSGERD